MSIFKLLKKTRKLAKGLKGDWQKEGYKLSVAQHDPDFLEIQAHTKDGKEAGLYRFSPTKGMMEPLWAFTHTEHQRKGLANAAYSLAEKHTGMKIRPSAVQTGSAEKFHAQPNKPFGKSTGIFSILSKLKNKHKDIIIAEEDPWTEEKYRRGGEEEYERYLKNRKEKKEAEAPKPKLSVLKKAEPAQDQKWPDEQVEDDVASQVTREGHHAQHSPGVAKLLTDVDLQQLYRAYKNTPHRPESLLLKYMIHRMEHADEYRGLSPNDALVKKQKFLDLHQKGGASDKNGHITMADLDNAVLNNSGAIAELSKHQTDLHNMLKEHFGHNIKMINGEPHIGLTRGLKVDKNERGEDHALASYAHIPATGFGAYQHHQMVPLKNIWYSFDFGKREASSDGHGPENEWLVSPHVIKYTDNANTTKPFPIRTHLHSKSMAALGNPNNEIFDDSDGALKVLANSSSPRVNAAHIHARLASEDKRNSFEAELARNPYIPVNIQNNIVNRLLTETRNGMDWSHLHDVIGENLSSNPGLSIQNQHRLIDGKQQLHNLASNRGLHPSSQKKMIELFPNSKLLSSLTYNKSITPENQRLIIDNSKDGSSVHHDVALSIHPENELFLAQKSKSEGVHRVLAEYSKNPKVQKYLADEGAYSAMRRLAVNKNLHPDVAMELARMSPAGSEVHMSLSGRFDAHPDLQKYLVSKNEGDSHVHRNIAFNPKTTDDIREEILNRAPAGSNTDYDFAMTNIALSPKIQWGLAIKNHHNQKIHSAMLDNSANLSPELKNYLQGDKFGTRPPEMPNFDRLPKLGKDLEKTLPGQLPNFRNRHAMQFIKQSLGNGATASTTNLGMFPDVSISVPGFTANSPANGKPVYHHIIKEKNSTQHVLSHEPDIHAHANDTSEHSILSYIGIDNPDERHPIPTIHTSYSQQGGFGLGSKLYELALKHHGKLQSDSSTSPSADKTWRKLLARPDVTGKMGIEGQADSPHVAEYKPMGKSTVSRDYEVPFGAGYSVSGDCVYIDKRLPRVMKLKDGREINIDKYLKIHEDAEKHLEDTKGYDYRFAHEKATGAERRAVLKDGIPWNEYQNFVLGHIKKISDIDAQVPADIDLKPERDYNDKATIKDAKKHGALVKSKKSDKNPNEFAGGRFDKVLREGDGYRIVSNYRHDNISHGSPTPITKFSTSKGTGQFGNGLYLAHDDDVAKFHAQGQRQGSSGQRPKGVGYQYNGSVHAPIALLVHNYDDFSKNALENEEAGNAFELVGDPQHRSVTKYWGNYAQDEHGANAIVFDPQDKDVLTPFTQTLALPGSKVSLRPKLAKSKKSDLQSLSKDPNGQEVVNFAHSALRGTMPNGQPGDENWANWYVKQYKKDPSIHTQENQQKITHYMGMKHLPQVANFKFNDKHDTFESGMNALGEAEAAGSKKAKSEEKRWAPSEGTKEIDLGNGWGWWNLNKPYSENEGAAMNHCGNVEGQHESGRKDTIYSLRQEDPSKHGMAKPYITAIANHGYLGEIKGVSNSKPSADFHDAMVALLLHKKIKGVVGSGYAPEANFQGQDLNPELYQKVISKKPRMFTPDKSELPAKFSERTDLNPEVSDIETAAFDYQDPHATDKLQTIWNNKYNTPEKINKFIDSQGDTYDGEIALPTQAMQVLLKNPKLSLDNFKKLADIPYTTYKMGENGTTARDSLLGHPYMQDPDTAKQVLEHVNSRSMSMNGLFTHPLATSEMTKKALKTAPRGIGHHAPNHPHITEQDLYDQFHKKGYSGDDIDREAVRQLAGHPNVTPALIDSVQQKEPLTAAMYLSKNKAYTQKHLNDLLNDPSYPQKAVALEVLKNRNDLAIPKDVFDEAIKNEITGQTKSTWELAHEISDHPLFDENNLTQLIGVAPNMAFKSGKIFNHPKMKPIVKDWIRKNFLTEVRKNGLYGMTAEEINNSPIYQENPEFYRKELINSPENRKSFMTNNERLDDYSKELDTGKVPKINQVDVGLIERLHESGNPKATEVYRKLVSHPDFKNTELVSRAGDMLDEQQKFDLLTAGRNIKNATITPEIIDAYIKHLKDTKAFGVEEKYRPRNLVRLAVGDIAIGNNNTVQMRPDQADELIKMGADPITLTDSLTDEQRARYINDYGNTLGLAQDGRMSNPAIKKYTYGMMVKGRAHKKMLPPSAFKPYYRGITEESPHEEIQLAREAQADEAKARKHQLLHVTLGENATDADLARYEHSHDKEIAKKAMAEIARRKGLTKSLTKSTNMFKMLNKAKRLSR